MTNKYVDTHTHIDHTMNKLQITLDNFPLFAKNNWPEELEKCVNVCCDIESFDPTEKLVENDKIYAGM
jgi:Tat protein secretion system quality control protein TatD with DNase activity